jgi:hypothetical protein
MKSGLSNKQLKAIAEKYKKALLLRDGGAELEKVRREMERAATLAEQVKILQSLRPPEW